MTTSTAPNRFLITTLGSTARVLDKVAQAAAWALSHFTRVAGGGVFCYGERRPFVAAWREDGPWGSRSYVLQLGYMEFGIDLRAPKGHPGTPAAN